MGTRPLRMPPQRVGHTALALSVTRPPGSDRARPTKHDRFLRPLFRAALTFGIGLIVAPLVVFFRDLERAVRLILRFTFYASPIIYSLVDLRDIGLERIGALNPFAGVITLYRAAFFPEQLDWFAVGVSVVISLVILTIGTLVFRRTISAVLKEI